MTESLTSLNRQLRRFGVRLSVAHESAQSVFSQLDKAYQIKAVFSHQEVGLQNTFERDRSMSRWFKQRQIPWTEFQNGAVIRGLKNRQSWDKDWKKAMRADLVNPDLEALKGITHDFDTTSLPKCWKTPNHNFQPGGEESAYQCLDHFYEQRGINYHRLISKPLASRESCSRLSPYLAWGNISLRSVYQRLLHERNRRGWRRATNALSSRLHWHCHFIQKFESECSMELKSVNAAYQQLPYRSVDADHDRLLKAWKQGCTGYPLIDACMRSLHETGYVNFRMRAMLVSFLTHHLNIHWRHGVAHLASLFLDFEPGIHYPQFQMQAGVTGINTIRIYNPTKQALEHDSEGTFISQWCPELAEIPMPLKAEPWLLTSLEQQMYGVQLGQHYPNPIVDLKQTYKQASDRLWSFRKRDDVKREAQRILARHVR